MTPAILYLLIAVGLIGTELLIMQLTVFWFLFFGLGAIITALLCWFMPELSWFWSTMVFLLSSIGVSAALFPIFRKMQSGPSPLSGNDAIGQTAKVSKDISSNEPGKVIWSGTEWPAQTQNEQDSFAVGETVIIRELEGIRIIVSK
jgi:membrane protein implicated in regulation of membrane protease activity